MATNPQLFQVIDIVVADIPDVYGLFLSCDWSQALKGYFSTNWSHLWFPKNGRPNQIRIDRERYMKHMVIEINSPNEPVLFSDSILGNYGYDYDLGSFPALKYAFTNSINKSGILHCVFQEVSPSLVNNVNTVNDVNSLVDKPWHLSFDGSRSNEGVGVGCMLLEPAGNKFMLSCRLEFICTNNIAEYEALI